MKQLFMLEDKKIIFEMFAPTLMFNTGVICIIGRTTYIIKKIIFDEPNEQIIYMCDYAE